MFFAHHLPLVLLTCLCTGLPVEADDEIPLGSFLHLIICSSWLTFPQEQLLITVSQDNRRTWWSNAYGSRRPQRVLNLTYFAIAVVFSALQYITIFFFVFISITIITKTLYP